MPGVLRTHSPVFRLDERSLNLLVSCTLRKQVVYIDKFEDYFTKFWTVNMDYKNFGYESVEDYLGTLPGTTIAREERTGRLVIYLKLSNVNGFANILVVGDQE